MGEYFLGISLTVLLGGLALSLFHDASAKPYLRLICGAAVVLSILSPIASFVGEVSDGNGVNDLLTIFENLDNEELNYAEIYNNEILNVGVNDASKRLKNEMIQALELDNDSFNVSIIAEVNGDEICISCVEVIIYPSGIAADPHKMEKYVRERLGCECVIIYG